METNSMNSCSFLAWRLLQNDLGLALSTSFQIKFPASDKYEQMSGCMSVCLGFPPKYASEAQV